MVKNLSAMQKTWFDPWVGKIPWRRNWQPTAVFLPGEFHGQRSLAGYSSWGGKELDTTKQLTLSLSFPKDIYSIPRAMNIKKTHTIYFLKNMLAVNTRFF